MFEPESVFECGVCGRVQRLSPGFVDAPKCGSVSEQWNDFPDGGWVQIRTHEPHGVMRLVEVVEGNPLGEAAEQNRLRWLWEAAAGGEGVLV